MLETDRLQAVFESIEDAIITIDETMSIISFNRGGEYMFGYIKAEVIGKPVDMLMPKELIQACAQGIHDFQHSQSRSCQPDEARQLYGCRKDGTQFPVAVSVVKTGPAGDMHFTAIIRDITTIQARQRHLQEKNDHLEALNKRLRSEQETRAYTENLLDRLLEQSQSYQKPRRDKSDN